MSRVWIFLDESGTVDFDSQVSPYFAFGSATLSDRHDDVYAAFMRARTTRTGLENGFHCYNDSRDTKAALFGEMKNLDIRYASTFMAKARAYSYVQKRPKIWLYKYTLFTHLQKLIPTVSAPGDDVRVIAAHISMGAKREAVIAAVDDVCQQFSRTRDVTPHIWKSPTSAGLQISDYALWATQRSLLSGRPCDEYDKIIKPREIFTQFPWGKV